MIEEWYKEALDRGLKVFKFGNLKCIFYKGFKITKSLDDIFIQDIRKSNMYNDLSKSDFKLMKKKGFIRGADDSCYFRDLRRIKSYTAKVERMYEKRKKFKKQFNKNPRLNEKRIRNLNRNIDVLVDQLFVFQVRVKQYEEKYN